eukprot:122139-Chlamydomonas_euryale.AAC.1
MGQASEVGPAGVGRGSKPEAVARKLSDAGVVSEVWRTGERETGTWEGEGLQRRRHCLSLLRSAPAGGRKHCKALPVALASARAEGKKHCEALPVRLLGVRSIAKHCPSLLRSALGVRTIAIHKGLGLRPSAEVAMSLEGAMSQEKTMS